MDFIHTELSSDRGWEGPGFAAFVSSVIESGTPPSAMAEIRDTLRGKGLGPYDCLCLTLMNILAMRGSEGKRHLLRGLTHGTN
ncbi:hypothetical protein [Paraburkholderia sp. BL6665CI2N2]|uniref:hypothetical protein n=1 Tax=Paraburkholderia sp. BL6665CI2N2 TaxID=1938806 RepID=UPI001064F64C|nr:hypothetical protein [Paraburkholderia sp. BL6665CI2N2]